MRLVSFVNKLNFGEICIAYGVRNIPKVVLPFARPQILAPSSNNHRTRYPSSMTGHRANASKLRHVKPSRPYPSNSVTPPMHPPSSRSRRRDTSSYPSPNHTPPLIPITSIHPSIHPSLYHASLFHHAHHPLPCPFHSLLLSLSKSEYFLYSTPKTSLTILPKPSAHPPSTSASFTLCSHPLCQTTATTAATALQNSTRNAKRVQKSMMRWR